MKLPIPQSVLERLKPLQDRVEGFLRRWEWTWTTTVVFSLAISFFALTFLAVIPSWFLYFADQTLKWRSFWLLKLRDAMAAGWITTWFAIILIAAYVMQSWRRRLRGGGGESRPGGGYR
ncbi:MAG: hypothetical protein HY658_11740 [Actinobacteria bacterium]|nr:hypothetical protein [Actinomycetota bacterium]